MRCIRNVANIREFLVQKETYNHGHLCKPPVRRVALLKIKSAVVSVMVDFQRCPAHNSNAQKIRLHSLG